MAFKTIIIALLVSFLTGCVAAVVAGAAGGLAVYDRRTVTMLEKDTRIFHVVHTDIVTDRRFRNTRIVVSSFNEVVLLVGQAPVASLREVAEKIAKNTRYVQRVYNQITVGHPISLVQQSKDTLITGQVRSKMLTQKGLASGSIRIITENATVYLMGIVTPAQANLAANVARHVEGVKKVVKVFQYVH